MEYKYPNNFLIPGYGFNVNVGRTSFHRSQQFELQGKVSVLADKPQPKAYGGPVININNQLPSICSTYLRKKVLDMPAWITLDKKVLCFDAFFQEVIPSYEPIKQIRKCKIYFYLEDATVKIIEPIVKNSGIPQGTLLSRQRVPFPHPKDEQYYDITDFNVGKEIEIFGKIFKITDCDNFTRNFLGRVGMTVLDPIVTPTDPYITERRQTVEVCHSKKVYKKKGDFIQFLAHDRQILTFYGFWDDRDSEYGFIHEFKINYFLSDDTMEVMEILPEYLGKGVVIVFLKRSKIPKHYSELPGPGNNLARSLLNVVWSNTCDYRTLEDRLHAGSSLVECYKPQDLAIGAVINVYGRKIVLSECDNFTKHYYRTKYGIEDFSPLPKPKEEPGVKFVPLLERQLPPWNGFGTYEDSAQNCITVEPKQIMRDIFKFYTLDRDGYDSRILRFRAKVITRNPVLRKRDFIISYYLVDDALAVFERLLNTCTCSTFLRKQKVPLPGENLFGSEPPRYYEASDMYIGAYLNINSFIFKLVDADEYALKYMELHPNEFPKSNVTIIMNKVRKQLRSTYKDFIARNILEKSRVIDYYKLNDELSKVMGDDWTEHEMITLGRHFRVVSPPETYSRDFVRQLVQTEIKKGLWTDFVRLKEYFYKSDSLRTRHLPRKDVYTLIKGCRVPLSVDVLNELLDAANKNEDGDIDYEDLFTFIDDTKYRLPDVNLPDTTHNPCKVPGTIERTAKLIDWCAFNNVLNLEDAFKNNVHDQETKEFSTSG